MVKLPYLFLDLCHLFDTLAKIAVMQSSELSLVAMLINSTTIHIKLTNQKW